jgi:hypothetical protein
MKIIQRQFDRAREKVHEEAEYAVKMTRRSKSRRKK